MTTSAWLMLSVTWLVIVAFALRFLIAVLRTPQRGSEDDEP